MAPARVLHLHSWLVGGVITIAALGSSAIGAIIYVDDSATGANDGTSWTDAFTDLQDALSAAKSGDEIRVGKGTYRPGPPGAPRTSTFNLVDGVNLQGGYAGVGANDPDALDPTQYMAALSGDLDSNDSSDPLSLNDNAYHVVTADGVSDQTRLAGFVIAKGRADVWQSCGSTGDHDRGGGFVGRNGAANLIEDCEFVNNAAACFGGGAYLGNVAPVPTIRRCRFAFNRTLLKDAGLGTGAGMCAFSPCVVEDTEFHGNVEAEYAAGACASGLFLRCVFSNNVAGEWGGGLSAGNATLIDCTFIGNGAQGGGGLACQNATIINCRFLGNQANCGSPNGGSAINGAGSVQIVNCLFSANSGGLGAVQFTGIHERTVANSTFIANVGQCNNGVPGGLNANSTQVRNCIFWDNAGWETAGQDHQIKLQAGSSITNSIVQDWDGSMGGYGNSDADPEFIDPNGPDNLYGTLDDNPRLSENSPARDEGNNAFLPSDDFDLDDDGDTMEKLPLDLDGLPRIVNSVVDLGPYEYQGPGCVGDAAPAGGDGTISVQDLLAVINQWGECAADCSADIDNNGTVDVQDLLLVIQYWGECG